MCIICVKPAGKSITKRTLKTCFTRNSDGAGFMYSDSERLFIHKGYMTFRRFYKDFRLCERACPESNFVLHFRIGVCGPNIPENTHPFRINDNLGIVHNGVISSLGSREINDTFVFASSILAKLPDNFLDNVKIKESIESLAVDSHSKFVFLDNMGNYTICNEKAGVWDNGLWFSNTTYKRIYFISAYSRYMNWDDDYPENHYTGTTSKLLQSTNPIETYYDTPAYKTPSCFCCNKTEDIISAYDNTINKVIYICRDCFSSLVDYASIICDNCYLTVTPEHGKCTFCHFDIDEKDLIRNLYSILGDKN